MNTLSPTVPMQRLTTTAVLPRYATDGAAGLDLHADLGHPADYMLLGPGERRRVQTGIGLALPLGFEGQVRPRSGLADKHGITVLNAPGTIDADFRGDVGVILHNTSHQQFVIRHGDRIAQLVIAPVARAELVEVADLGETERGVGGFGSTGVAVETGLFKDAAGVVHVHDLSTDIGLSFRPDGKVDLLPGVVALPQARQQHHAGDRR